MKTLLRISKRELKVIGDIHYGNEACRRNYLRISKRELKVKLDLKVIQAEIITLNLKKRIERLPEVFLAPTIRGDVRISKRELKDNLLNIVSKTVCLGISKRELKDFFQPLRSWRVSSRRISKRELKVIKLMLSASLSSLTESQKEN